MNRMTPRPSTDGADVRMKQPPRLMFSTWQVVPPESPSQRPSIGIATRACCRRSLTMSTSAKFVGRLRNRLYASGIVYRCPRSRCRSTGRAGLRFVNSEGSPRIEMESSTPGRDLAATGAGLRRHGLHGDGRRACPQERAAGSAEHENQIRRRCAPRSIRAGSCRCTCTSRFAAAWKITWWSGRSSCPGRPIARSGTRFGPDVELTTTFKVDSAGRETPGSAGSEASDEPPVHRLAPRRRGARS